MKLTYETSDEVSFGQELNEATGDKKYVIKGVFSSPGKKNRNGRVYPMHLWEREVAKYQDIIKSGHPNSLMELEHPPRSNVDMMEAVAKVRKMWIENGFVMGEAVLLDNPKANQLKTLIDAGIKMAVSTRGAGKIGMGGIVEDYNLICVDVISNLQQSDHMAEMYGITEGVLQDKEFDLNEKGDLVEICSKDKCLRENRTKVNEAILSKFNELFDVKLNEEVTYECSIDLNYIKERKRNELITALKLLNKRYKLEDKILSMSYRTLIDLIERVEFSSEAK